MRHPITCTLFFAVGLSVLAHALGGLALAPLLGLFSARPPAALGRSMQQMEVISVALAEQKTAPPPLPPPAIQPEPPKEPLPEVPTVAKGGLVLPVAPTNASAPPIKELPVPPTVAKPPPPAPEKNSGPAQASTAQVSQQASLPAAGAPAPEIQNGAPVPPQMEDLALARLRALIEREKYYPPAARRAGLAGRVTAVVQVAADGRISGYRIAGRSGHVLFEHTVKAMLAGIVGRPLGIAMPRPLDVQVPISFEIE